MVIAGDEITLTRETLTPALARMFRVPDEARVVEDWREQHDATMPVLHMTSLYTSEDKYAVVIWALDSNIADEALRLGLPLWTGLTVYGIGTLDVRNDDEARMVVHQLAGMVARADLPWPPEDHVDTEVWRAAETALYRSLAR